MSVVPLLTKNGSSESKPEPPQFRVPRSAGRRETLEEKLKRRQAEIAARLQAIATRRKEEFRDKEARLDRVIGAACRADKSLHEGIKTALKSVKTPADREFLKIEGWL
jgi:hypothetical protein